MKPKNITAADLIIVLFLAVTIPHSADMLKRFEYAEWHWLAWSLSAAIDIGIAYGGVVSSGARADKITRRWATLLFVGLSVGSYALNIAHYVTFGAGWYALGLGAFFPVSILLLAKIKSRLETAGPLVSVAISASEGEQDRAAFEQQVRSDLIATQTTQTRFASDMGHVLANTQQMVKELQSTVAGMSRTQTLQPIEAQNHNESADSGGSSLPVEVREAVMPSGERAVLIAQAKDLRSQGKSNRAIGAQLNKSETWVRGVLKNEQS